MRGPSSLQRFRRWVLLGGNRSVIAVATLGLFFVGLVVVDPAAPVSGDNSSPVVSAFGSVVAGNLSLLVIVISINQLVLSQELVATDDLRDEIDAITEFRRRVADVSGYEVPPTIPGGFLTAIIDGIRADVDTLETAADRAGEPAEDVVDFTSSLTADLDEAERRMGENPDRVADVLAAMLALDLTGISHRVRTLRAAHGAALPAEGTDALDSILGWFRTLNLARNQFKSMYTHITLSNMSRVILVVGLPAQAVAVAVMLALTDVVRPGSSLVLPPTVVYVGLTVAFVPLVLVFAYIIQAATIARQTSTTMEFAEQKRE